MKFQNTFLLITLVIGLLPSSISASTSENHHAPRLYRGTMDWPSISPPYPPEDESPPEWAPQPFMAGYMDADGIYSRVDRIRVTVSFPDTNPSVIQSDNWLAGGMFAVGYEDESVGGHPQIDYGYYYMLTLDHDGSLYLDFGINQTYECLFNPVNLPWFPNGTLPWTRGLFNATVPIEGVSHSTPITLTASWDTLHLGWVSWDYTVSGITYPAGAVNVTELAPTIQHVFYVGSRDLEDLALIANPSLNWIPYWQTYCFQFGIISLYNIGHGGWNVLLSNPSYFKDGEWHNAETALSIGGVHAMLDYRWMWGGENYEGVEAINYPYPNNLKFHYSGSTLKDLTPLWVPDTPHVIGIPVAPADSSETHTYFLPPTPDFAYAEVDTNRVEYRLEVGSQYLNGSDSYANATLSKNFSSPHTVTNPTFYFRFHDKGYMNAPYGNTTLTAFLRLLHNGNQLFQYNPVIHTATGSSYSADCFHKISKQYYGELLANNTYTIEYGFAASEHEAYADFRSDEYARKIKASWLVLTDNYKLTVRTYELGGDEITNVDVWIDSTQYSSPVENLVVACGDHTVQVESPFYQNGHRYAFQYWEDGNTSNPRTVNILNDTTLRAYYIREPLCAMKTKTNGYFYVPIVATDLLKIEILFNIPNFTGDQTGGTSPYGSIGNYPDGRVNIKDSVFINSRFGSNETSPNWDYMADVVPDRKINIKDITAMNINFGYSGTYPPLDLTGVQVIFNTNDIVVPDSYGFVSIPQNATSFTVYKNSNTIGAMITFW